VIWLEEKGEGPKEGGNRKEGHRKNGGICSITSEGIDAPEGIGFVISR